MGLLMLQSGTIRAGLARAAQSVSALQSATDIQISARDDIATFGDRIRDPALRGHAQDTEFSLSATCRLIRMAFGPRWRPLEVQLEHRAGADPRRLERIFRAPVRFGQEASRLILASRGLDAMHRDEDDALIGLIERHVAGLAAAPQAGTLCERVARLVERNLGQRPLTVSKVAGELGLARRTLQRRLNAEGTSLRRIVEARRRALVDD